MVEGNKGVKFQGPFSCLWKRLINSFQVKCSRKIQKVELKGSVVWNELIIRTAVSNNSSKTQVCEDENFLRLHSRLAYSKQCCSVLVFTKS